MQVRELAQTAREASRVLAVVSGEVRKQALETIAQALEANELKILAANARDMEAGKELVEKGKSAAKSIRSRGKTTAEPEAAPTETAAS